ncbi:MAG: ISAzo13 family transposase, partial [Pirellula sp.]|nr:ISAzo13 family transposase [Pirellula sp.]
TLEVIVSLIGNTRTTTGLEVHAWVDGKKYEKARSVSDEELAEVSIRRNKFHGEWNYEIHPTK